MRDSAPPHLRRRYDGSYFTGPPSSTSEYPTAEAFQAALSAELSEKGVSLTALQELEDHIFNGKPELYERMVKYLDSFGTNRLAAYVRAAEALMRWQGLMQSQA